MAPLVYIILDTIGFILMSGSRVVWYELRIALL